ncbi:hypothetical protein Bca4012_100964 [Brassica carinata]
MRGNLWKLTFFCLMRRFPVVIRFKNLTEFVEITTPPAIPLELFRFYDYGQLIALLNTNHQFPDVLRFVGVINSTFSDHEQSARPIMVDLQVDSLTVVCCNGRGGNDYLGDDIPGVHVSPANALMDKG